MNIFRFSYIAKTTNLCYYDDTGFCFSFIAKTASFYRYKTRNNVTNESHFEKYAFLHTF